MTTDRAKVVDRFEKALKRYTEAAARWHHDRAAAQYRKIDTRPSRDALDKAAREMYEAGDAAAALILGADR